MNIVVIGCEYSTLLLSKAILKKGFNIVLLVTLKEDSSYKKVRWISLRKFAKDNHITLLEIESMFEMSQYLDKTNLSFDILYEVGWSYLIPKSIFSLAKLGSYGFHPSLLPQGKGVGLIGGVIDGYSSWGASIFALNEEFDEGKVLMHREFDINIDDDISTLYNKAEASYIELFENTISQIINQNFTPKLLDVTPSKYERRVPNDGEINLQKSDTSLKLHNFIRAQSRPYPGAFLYIEDKKLYIWKTIYDSTSKKLEILRVQYEDEAERWFYDFKDQNKVIKILRSCLK